MLDYTDAGKKGQFIRIEERSWAKGFGEAFIFDGEIEHLLIGGDYDGNFLVLFTDQDGHRMGTAVPSDEFIFA